MEYSQSVSRLSLSRDNSLCSRPETTIRAEAGLSLFMRGRFGRDSTLMAIETSVDLVSHYHGCNHKLLIIFIYMLSDSYCSENVRD